MIVGSLGMEGFGGARILAGSSFDLSLYFDGSLKSQIYSEP